MEIFTWIVLSIIHLLLLYVIIMAAIDGSEQTALLREIRDMLKQQMQTGQPEAGDREKMDPSTEESDRNCPACRHDLADTDVECPSCGLVLVDPGDDNPR
ncbi:hypothetical protein LOK74_19420 [Brevibacillus humidisoli]|uniref:TFIIB-type zinc ribbon-containing protein n=1 Tax=Brevibacillus humidisoli TaxID=2895522 RepID=UPI001E3F02B1|nr:zf-TFIIB domain-containing protein [Brevibacillus humidisoli]UFJ40183.1 hypothetical protein LOK74_19420 [Brevibacillus humidisoli]